MRIVCMFLGITLYFSGCSTNYLLMDKDEFNRYRKRISDEHRVMYYKVIYTINDNGTLLENTHFILLVGKNIHSLEGSLFSITDGSGVKLKKYAARHCKLDGSTTSFSKGDLLEVLLSNRSRISEEKLLHLPVKSKMKPGDLFEQVSISENKQAPFGIKFYPNIFGDDIEYAECEIRIPADVSLNYKVINDTVNPSVMQEENQKIYYFKWKNRSVKKNKSEYAYKNQSPAVYAQAVIRTKNGNLYNYSWKDFGNWYLNLIEDRVIANDRIKRFAVSITKDATSNIEKLDAIFAYCQKNIRYEQVYLKYGEYIPNKAEIILERKYGDCKDYSTLIYTLARSLNIPVDFALCYRGRGIKFYDNFAMDQFNHVIIHFRNNDRDYWYDATNRTGLPGLTTPDLINQQALVIKPGNSELITIKDDHENLFFLTGNIICGKKDISGHFKISLCSQYAIDFFYYDYYYNREDMLNLLMHWLQYSLNENIIIKKLNWAQTLNEFIVDLDCSIPNVIVNIGENCFLSFDRIFPSLLPKEYPQEDSEPFFYYPKFSHVKMAIDMENFISDYPGGQNSRWDLSFNFSPGPYKNQEGDKIKKEIENIKNAMGKKYKRNVLP